MDISTKKNLSIDYSNFFRLNIHLIYTERITVKNKKIKKSKNMIIFYFYKQNF